MAESDESIIPLSRWRAALARARRGHKADAILSEPDAAQLVPRLPVQDLFYAIKEVGLADAQELVALATPEQLQGFVDLDVWDRDQIDEVRVNAWMETLADAGFETLGKAVEVMDSEVIALWIQRQAVVYDVTIEQPPDEPQGHYFPTPDRFFLLDIIVGEEDGKALERCIDWIYRFDIELGRRVIMSAKWELASDLEEHAYRWRAGRMADMGYVDFYEALSIYRYLDPTTVHADEHTIQASPPATPTELPAVLAGALDEAGFFGKALATLPSDADVERLHASLLLLVNKAMAADLVPPGDTDAGKVALTRAVAYLGLGLEFLSRGDVARAGLALSSVALERLFRLGFSLTVQLKTLADTLVTKGGVDPIALETPWDDILRALRQRRPELSRALDDKPAEGNRPFQTLADVAKAASAIEKIATMRARE